MLSRLQNGNWKVDIRPEGRNGKRIRKVLPSKAEAARFEALIKNEVTQGREWNPSKKDTRQFSKLIEIWFDIYGQFLSDGSRTLNILNSINSAMGNPIASALTPNDFLTYRKNKQGINGKAINPKTLNNHLGYLNTVFNKLRKSKVILYANPFADVDKIRLHERELSYLTEEQIIELFDAIDYFCKNPGVALITEICLSTGCRWGEAESLDISRVRNGTLTFTNTKSKKSRSIPIDKKLENKISKHGKKQKPLFSGKPLLSFDKALKKCSFNLPTGQSSHVLRHTYASHFIMDGGDIMTLQRILGHSTILMTMKYAHLAPDHLTQAKKFNPLRKISKFKRP